LALGAGPYAPDDGDMSEYREDPRRASQRPRGVREHPRRCLIVAGNNGVIIMADSMLPPRKHGVLVPGPQFHAMKIAFEKYFLWKARPGYVNLP
jgi:hypothetical protein